MLTASLNIRRVSDALPGAVPAVLPDSILITDPTGSRAGWLPQGSVGATGAVGPTGGAGLGAPGATGPAGVVGATGQVGVLGATGPAGVLGATGPAGMLGATGPAGVLGATGPAGVLGATGTIGTSGVFPIGATGATGPSVSNFYWSATNSFNNNTNRFISMRSNVSTVEIGERYAAVTRTLTKFTVRLLGTLYATATLSVTLRLNRTNTALVVSLVPGASSGTATGSVAISAGDRLSVVCVESVAENKSNIHLRVRVV